MTDHAMFWGECLPGCKACAALPVPSQAALDSLRVDMPVGLTPGEKRAFIMGVAAAARGHVADRTVALTPDELDALLQDLERDHGERDFESECPACTGTQKLRAALRMPMAMSPAPAEGSLEVRKSHFYVGGAAAGCVALPPPPFCPLCGSTGHAPGCPYVSAGGKGASHG